MTRFVTRKRAVLVLGIFIGLIGAGGLLAQERPGYEIQLLGQTWTPAAGVSAELRETLGRQAAELAGQGKETIHVLVQLYETPGESEKLELARQGLDLGAYVPNQAWIAAVPVGKALEMAGRPEVRHISHWDASRKVHPRIKERDWAGWSRNPERPDWVVVFVQLHHDVPLEAGEKLAAAAGGVPASPVEGLHGLAVWIEEKGIAALAAKEEVLWIQEGPSPLTPNNDGVLPTMNVTPLLSPPYSLTGTGVRVFVYDGGTVRSTHESFSGGRVTLLDATALSSHSTHVAGTVGGDGLPSSVPAGSGRGVAIGSTILSAGFQPNFTPFFHNDTGDIQADYALARNTHNADLGTNSIGSNTAANGFPCGITGDYDLSGSLLDGIIRGDNATVGSAVLMTWAAGNERSGGGGRCGAGYRTTAPPSCAKNPIHVGATNSDGSSMTSFSSWGPCDDGRLKPVISAPGCESGRVTGETAVYSSTATSNTSYGLSCGTSMATPAVAGTVALLIEDWRAQGHGGANARPLPALVKALLIHSARDQGQAGPDFIYGYGSVDAKALIDLLRAGTGALGTANAVNWGTGSAANGGVATWNVTVPAGTGELKATLAWDDAAAAAFVASAPVNNLRLELVSPTGAVSNPWVLNAASPHLPATTGINSLDNQEQVLVTNPAAGVWTVRVTGTNVPTGPQSFGLVYTTTPAPPSNCTTTSFTFEAGNDGFTLSGGAARVAAPAAGHGAFSLRVGNAVNQTGAEAIRNTAIPAVPRAELSYWWYKNTARATTPWHRDQFLFEIRNATTGAVLSVIDFRTDGWQQAQWMQQQKVDLTPWAGQTIRLAFRGTQDNTLATSFFVDDVQLTTCQ